MWRLFLAAIGFVGDNPLYELGRKRRLPWWQARPALAGLASLCYSTAGLWLCDQLCDAPGWFASLFVMGGLWMPFLALPVLGAALAATAGGADSRGGPWRDAECARRPAEQILVARVVCPLRAVGALMLGMGAGWIVRVVTVDASATSGNWQTLGAFALVMVAGLLALAGLMVDALRRGIHRSPATAVAGAVAASLVWQVAMAAPIAPASQVIVEVADLNGATARWAVFWGLDALMNSLAASILWGRAVRALRWTPE